MIRLGCAPCGRLLAPKKIGVSVEELAPLGLEYEPYKLWAADLMACPECQAEVVVFADQPLAEHYQADYARRKAFFPPLVTVR